ncbi:MAG: hypothetical protein AMXMBFR13_46250 [Phycisphaerae bacterium]
MSTIDRTAPTLDLARAAAAEPARRQAMLRQAADELVGVTFFGKMLAMARNSAIKGTIGHGGRGEEIFGAQLDQELARRVGQNFRNSLSEAIYQRLVNKV